MLIALLLLIATPLSAKEVVTAQHSGPAVEWASVEWDVDNPAFSDERVCVNLTIRNPTAASMSPASRSGITSGARRSAPWSGMGVITNPTTSR